KAIFITHGHFDHIGAVEEIRKNTGAEVIAHKEGKRYLHDPQFNLSTHIGETISFDADKYVGANEELNINNGELQFKVIYVPGHSADGVAYYHKPSNSLFVGDIIFRASIGRTDLPGSDSLKLISGIKEKILTLSDDTTLYPGHGLKTTVAFEKKNNPFIN
ncbi:hypothetical protein AN642_02840, partial [Epulopiscium sp. SCG-B10WGA-EpuloA2]